MGGFRLTSKRLPRRVWFAVLCAALTLGLHCGCGDGGPAARESAPPGPSSSAVERLREGARSANVIIILLDAARADHFGFLGYQRDTTPNADALFAESIVFDHAYCQVPDTKASVTSLLTAQYPSTHRVWGMVKSLPPDTTTLGEALQRGGLRTACFSANPHLSPEFGLDRGFDDFQEIFLQARLSETATGGAVPAELVAGAAAEWFARRKEERFFAYLHFLEPHKPYAAPEPFLTKYRSEAEETSAEDQVALYDGTLSYVDHVVGQLLAELRRLGLLDTSIVILMADHGEAFGEHGEFGHVTTAYEEAIHIPLAIRLPSACGAQPAVRSEIISVTDLMPTILDLLGIPIPASAQGASRIRLLAGETEPQPAIAISRSRGRDPTGGLRQPEQVIYAVTAPRYTLLIGDQGRRLELYDRDSDPGQKNNLIEKSPEVAADLHRRFEQWAEGQATRPVVLGGEEADAPDAPTAELSERTREHLKALGYLK